MDFDRFKAFPHFLQLDRMDCGPTCLRMIAKYYGRSYTLQYLRERSFITREGVSMLGISDAAESIGFHTMGVKVSLEQLKNEIPLPCILHWNQNHFVVLYDIKKGGLRNILNKDSVPSMMEARFYIADPASTKVVFNEEEFKRCWISSRSGEKDTGTALLLEPGPEFDNKADEDEKKGKEGSKEKQKSNAKRAALSVIITILIIILVIVISCIIVLKLMPDSIGAYYIQDFIALVQGKLAGGGA